MEVRPAREGDVSAIADIYSFYVDNSVATFHEKAPPASWWSEKFAGRIHPWLVSEEDGAITGYAYGAPHREKEAYARTVETTIYLRDGSGGRGVGRALYGQLLDECREAEMHLAVAGITLPNDASVALHERLGFTHTGTFTEIGHKHGAWRDVGWWQLRL